MVLEMMVDILLVQVDPIILLVVEAVPEVMVKTLDLAVTLVMADQGNLSHGLHYYLM